MITNDLADAKTQVSSLISPFSPEFSAPYETQGWLSLLRLGLASL